MTYTALMSPPFKEESSILVDYLYINLPVQAKRKTYTLKIILRVCLCFD